MTEQTLLSWLEDFCDQLDCPLPPLTGDTMDNLKRVVEWETQMFILKKLRHAVNVEKEKLEKDML